MLVIVENLELCEQHRLTKVIFFPFFYFDYWCHAFCFLFVIEYIYEFDHRDRLQHKGHKMVWWMLWSLSLIVTNLVTSNRCIRKSYIIQTLKFLKMKSKIMKFFWNEINDQNLARKWFLQDKNLMEKVNYVYVHTWQNLSSSSSPLDPSGCKLWW